MSLENESLMLFFSDKYFDPPLLYSLEEEKHEIEFCLVSILWDHACSRCFCECWILEPLGKNVIMG